MDGALIITAIIFACSLPNFLSISGQIHEDDSRARAEVLTFCYCKKQIEVCFSCVCFVIDNELRQNIVKVICRSTRR